MREISSEVKYCKFLSHKNKTKIDIDNSTCLNHIVLNKSLQLSWNQTLVFLNI